MPRFHAMSFVHRPLAPALLLLALIWQTPGIAADAQAGLRVAAARTFADPGLVSYLGELFERKTGVAVQVAGVGALTALDYGREGRADLLLTHFPIEQERFIHEGYGVFDSQIAYSQYALFGPREEAGEFAGMRWIGEALSWLRDQEAEMLVPSPRSGTYRKLEELWAAAGLDPDWISYENTGSSATATLQQAADRGTYAFADLGLFLLHRQNYAASIQPLFRDDISLRNELSAIVVNAAKVPGVQQQLAHEFFHFLISQEGQQAIADFSRERFGSPLYTPSAHLDRRLSNHRLEEQLAVEAQRRQLMLIAGVLFAVLVAMVLFLMRRNQRLDRINWEKRLELEKAQRGQEVAQRAERYKSRFLATMSHEIRTPLNGVLGIAGMGRRDAHDAPTRKRFEQIHAAGQHLLHVVNDILDFSKIEAGKLPIEHLPFQLLRAVEDTLALLEDAAAAKSLQVELHCREDLPPWVQGDAMRLQQILLNLLSNAVKFTPQGRIDIELAWQAGELQMQVIDTGIGMSEAQCQKMFLPFEQADGSTTRQFGGTGLGMAISQRLAQLMGGGITVQSALGEGSNFSLRLPLPQVDAPPASGDREQQTGALSLAGLRVLAAEDIAVNRLILEDMLALHGAQVSFAENGQQAVDLLRESGVEAFDLVLMDVQMPVMNGYDATRQISAFAPGLPVIGLTAHVLEEEKQMCLDAGMLDHLTKPLDAETLVSTIRQHVDWQAAGA